MRSRPLVAFIGTVLFVLLGNSARSEELPEFYGVYVKSSSGAIKELAKNEKIYTTGWFTGNDLNAALEATMNTHEFITTFSNISLPASDAKGLILYTESDISKVTLNRLSNKVIPEGARFAEYHGPQPANRDDMFFQGAVIEVRAKPLKEKMYYVQPKDALAPGCYVVKMGAAFYDFEVKGTSDKNPLVGKWTGKYYMKEKKLIGGETYFYDIEMQIDSIAADGTVSGSYKQYNAKKEVSSEGAIEGMTIDQSTGKVRIVNKDEGKEGNLYGEQPGNLGMTNSEKCRPGQATIRLIFQPYAKYKDHDFLKKYDLSWVYEKSI